MCDQKKTLPEAVLTNEEKEKKNLKYAQLLSYIQNTFVYSILAFVGYGRDMQVNPESFKIPPPANPVVVRAGGVDYGLNRPRTTRVLGVAGNVHKPYHFSRHVTMPQLTQWTDRGTEVKSFHREGEKVTFLKSLNEADTVSGKVQLALANASAMLDRSSYEHQEALGRLEGLYRFITVQFLNANKSLYCARVFIEKNYRYVPFECKAVMTLVQEKQKVMLHLNVHNPMTADKGFAIYSKPLTDPVFEHPDYVTYMNDVSVFVPPITDTAFIDSVTLETYCDWKNDKPYTRPPDIWDAAKHDLDHQG